MQRGDENVPKPGGHYRNMGASVQQRGMGMNAAGRGGGGGGGGLIPLGIGSSGNSLHSGQSVEGLGADIAEIQRNNAHKFMGGGNFHIKLVPPEPSYPEYPEDMKPPIVLGDPSRGYVEVEIPNQVVGLVIGKAAANVKALKDRCRCDISVQKDEVPGPDPNIRLVRIRGTFAQITAVRNELAKIIAVRFHLSISVYLCISLL